jgi:type II secretory pathway component PulF
MRDRNDIGGLMEAPGRYFCPLISYPHQRLALGLLFRELALAVRHRFPLDVVLETIAASKRIRPGARYLLPGGVIALGALVLGLALIGLTVMGIVVAVAGGMLLVLLSVRRHDDFVRFVANRLAAGLARGKTLSEAMFSLPMIFNHQERQTVLVGEHSGRLAETLETLAEYNAQTGRFNRLFAAILYPLTVFMLCLMIVGFIAAKILPKQVDIFRQLGGDLPRWTETMVSTVFYPLYSSFFLAFILVPFLVLLIFCVIVPRLLQGNVVLTVLFLIFVGVDFGCALVPIAVNLMGSAPNAIIAITYVSAALSSSAILAIGVYYLVRWINTLLPYFAQRIGAWAFGYFGPVRKAYLSRFLLSLGYSLRAKIPFPDALEMAGQATGGRLRGEAQRLRAMVEQGHSFADGIASSPHFRGQVGAILSLSEWRGSLAEDCIELAEQLHFEARRASERLAALIEWPSIVVVGIILGAFVIAIYLPIFTIPTMVR